MSHSCRVHVAKIAFSAAASSAPSSLLGHASIQLTIDTYSKLFERQKTDDADDAKAELAKDEAALFAVS